MGCGLGWSLFMEMEKRRNILANIGSVWSWPSNSTMPVLHQGGAMPTLWTGQWQALLFPYLLLIFWNLWTRGILFTQSGSFESNSISTFWCIIKANISKTSNHIINSNLEEKMKTFMLIIYIILTLNENVYLSILWNFGGLWLYIAECRISL